MTGMVGVLKAISEHARSHAAAGGPDIPLTQEITHIGRNVPRVPGLPLPMQWAQVSGKHCQAIGNTSQGYKVFDTSTNGSYIIRANESVDRVPKNGSLPIAAGEVLRLSTVPTNNPSHVLEYRLEYITDETRVRKAEDSAEADGALPAKRLCMSNGGDTPDKEASAEQNRKLDQLMQTQKELQIKLQASRGETEAARQQLDAKAAEAQRLAADLAAARKQAEEAAAAAATEAAQRCEQQIKQLSDAKADLTTQLEQQKQAVRAGQEANAGLTADLAARQDELQQLKQQLADAQQHKDGELEALKASSSDLQSQLASVTADAAQLRDQLQNCAEEAQELREQAEAAGEVQRRAQEEAETLRQQLTSSQRDAQAALTKQEDMEVGMQVMRNELAVNEEHLKNQVKQWAKQRTQWQQLAIALQRYNEAQAALLEPHRQLAAAASSLGNHINEKAAAAAAKLPAPSHGGDSGAAAFNDTQHTMEVSSHNPAVGNGIGGGPSAVAGTQAASSAPAPTAAAPADAEAVQQQHIGTAPYADNDGAALQHDSAPDAGTQLDDMAPAVENGVGSAPAFEPGQKQDTLGLGRTTGSGAGDTPANGGGSSLAADQDAADSEDEEASDCMVDEAAAAADGGAAPAEASPTAAAAQQPSGSGEDDDDEDDEDGGAEAEQEEGEGEAAARDDEAEDDDMEP